MSVRDPDYSIGDDVKLYTGGPLFESEPQPERMLF